MDLAQLAEGSLKAFVAKLYDGHFERGGQRLGKIRVEIEKTVLSAKLDAGAPPEKRARYLVFGEGGEYFAAHLVQGRPSFDAILEVDRAQWRWGGFCRTRLCDEPWEGPVSDLQLPLTLDGPADARLLSPGPVPSGSPLALGTRFLGPKAVVRQVLYVEEGDLSH
jgi:hypothetical protein